MNETPSNPWQYSLAGLMILVAISGIACAFAGLVGYATVLVISPIVWLFWMIYRNIDGTIDRRNRNRRPQVSEQMVGDSVATAAKMQHEAE